MATPAVPGSRFLKKPEFAPDEETREVPAVRQEPADEKPAAGSDAEETAIIPQVQEPAGDETRVIPRIQDPAADETAVIPQVRDGQQDPAADRPGERNARDRRDSEGSGDSEGPRDAEDRRNPADSKDAADSGDAEVAEDAEDSRGRDGSPEAGGSQHAPGPQDAPGSRDPRDPRQSWDAPGTLDPRGGRDARDAREVRATDDTAVLSPVRPVQDAVPADRVPPGFFREETPDPAGAESANERTRELPQPHPDGGQGPVAGYAQTPPEAERPRRRSDWAEETPLDDLPTLADELLGPHDDDRDENGGRRRRR
ncbi:hypothetical protein [Streptomyces sp. SID1121]|uniref:hypothetical protein n=1 Tax=Streptomyces sp. SID1121 TaxID=3425888 RepID=UPI004056E13D